MAGVSYPLFPVTLPFSLPPQAMARIILAQRSCHIAITTKLAFRSILAMCRCTIITLLVDFIFEVLILDEYFNPKI